MINDDDGNVDDVGGDVRNDNNSINDVGSDDYMYMIMMINYK